MDETVGVDMLVAVMELDVEITATVLVGDVTFEQVVGPGHPRVQHSPRPAGVGPDPGSVQ